LYFLLSLQLSSTIERKLIFKNICMALDANYYKKKQARSLYYSIAFLAVVILGTVGLYFYNGHLENQNSILDNELVQVKSSIAKLKEDKKIESYHIYSLNEKAFQKLEKYSGVSDMIGHLVSTMLRYDLSFQSFSYAKGVATLNASSTSSEEGLAYRKITKFIEEYSDDSQSLFTILPTDTYTGHDKIQFPLQLELK